MVGALLLNANFKIHFSLISCQARVPLPVKPAPLRMPSPHYPHWASLQADIEAHLKQTIPLKEPLEVFEPMLHLAFSAPRTTVPALCLAACELVGGHRQQAMAAASALLLNLANAHAHEHLTDGPMYGPNIELLTGDGIVPFGFELLARPDGPASASPERVLRVMIEISRAVGSVGLQDAQYVKKTLWDGGEEVQNVESMQRFVLEKRDGGLHACGAASGAILGGGSEDQIERLRNFGFHVGMMRGMLQMGFMEKHVQEERHLALKELQFFMDRDVHVISSFIY